MLASREFILQKIVKNPLFGWDFCVVQGIHFALTKTNKLMSTKSHCLYIIGRPVRHKKFTTFVQFAKKMESFNQKLTKFTFSINTQSHFMSFYKKRIQSLKFVQDVNFVFKDSLKNNGTKNLLIFDNSSEAF